MNVPQHISCWVILFPWLFPGVLPHRGVTWSSTGDGKCQGKEEGTPLTSHFLQIYTNFSLFLLNNFFYFMMFSFPVWFGDFRFHCFCTMSKEQDASPFSWTVFFLASIHSNTPSSPFLSLYSESSQCLNIKPLCVRQLEDGPIILLERTLSSKWGLQCRGQEEERNGTFLYEWYSFSRGYGLLRYFWEEVMKSELGLSFGNLASKERWPLLPFFLSFTSCLTWLRGFPDSSVGRESVYNVGDPGLISGSGRSTGERERLPTPVFSGFPCGSVGKESACNVGDLGLIPGLGRSPGEGKGYPLQYSGLENSMDPWGCQESDMTEWLSLTWLKFFDWNSFLIFFVCF